MLLVLFDFVFSSLSSLLSAVVCLLTGAELQELVERT